MNKISSIKARTPPTIIDVREPGEYAEKHFEGAINLPSAAFNIEDYIPYRHHPISLVCNTGIRASQVKDKLDKAGFQAVELHPVQMQHLREKENVGIDGSWTIDRQFRLFIGMMMLISLAGFYLGVEYMLAINIIICLGLTITAIIDRCYLKMGIARLPWNQKD